MDSGDRKFLVLVGLTQTGIIVGGILGCGVALRAAPGTGGLTRLLRERGLFLLLVPVIWTVVAAACLHRLPPGAGARVAAEVAGLTLLVVLMGLVSVAIVVPFVRLAVEI